MVWFSMKIQLNLRRLGIVLGSLVILAVGVFALHRFQMKRNATGLLALAAHADEKGEYDREGRFLNRYLLLVPQDTAIRARFGQVLEKKAKASRSRPGLLQACAVYEEVVRREPGRADVRRQLADLETDLRMFDTALVHVEILLKDNPEDAGLEVLLARCCEGRNRNGDLALAQEHYYKAITEQPTLLEGYVRLATLLQRNKNADEADDVLQLLVYHNPDSLQAFVEFGHGEQAIRKSLEGLDENCIARGRNQFEALIWVNAILQTIDVPKKKDAPDPLLLDVSLLLADWALDSGRFAEANTYLGEGLALKADDWRFYHARARVAMVEEQKKGSPQQGRRKAIDCFRAGLKKIPGRVELLRPLAELLLVENDLEQVREVVEALHKVWPAADELDFLESRILVAEGNWPDAKRKLEAVRSRLVLSQSEPLRARVCLLLGKCYEQLKDDRRKLDAYTEAKRLDPESVAGIQARWTLALELIDAPGRLDEAIREFEAICKLPQRPQVAILALVRLLIVRNLNVPQGERNWDAVNDKLNEAEWELPNDVNVPILRAEALVARGDAQGGGLRTLLVIVARTLLKRECVNQPQVLAPRLTLAALASHTGQHEMAVEDLDIAARACGNSADLCLARIRVFEETHPPLKTTAPLEKVAQDLKELPRPERIRVTQGLAQAYLRCGDKEKALQLTRTLASEAAGDLNIQLFWFEMALVAEAKDDLENAAKAIKQVDNDGALGLYAEASQQVWEASRPGGDRTKLLAAARQNLADARFVRPDWSRLSLCQARLDEQDHNPGAAIENYRQALAQGERDPETLRVLVRLLHQRGDPRDYREADEAIRKLQTLVPNLADDMQKIAAELSLRRSEFDRALEQARRAVNVKSASAGDLIWLSQMLWAGGRTNDEKGEAEKMLRDAIKKYRDVPEKHSDVAELQVHLVRHLVRAHKPDEARKVLDALGSSKLPTEEILLAEARCHEILGERDQAAPLFEKAVEKAVEIRSEEVKTRRAAAEFYLRINQPRLALGHLDWLVKASKDVSDEEKAQARRNLALGLTDGNYEEFLRAVQLLETRKDPADLRTLAQVLMTRDFTRDNAIKIFEQLLEQQKQQPGKPGPRFAAIYFFLARLHDIEGDWTQARKLYQEALYLDKQNLAWWSTYTLGLLRHGPINEAKVGSQYLNKIDLEALETAVVRARLQLALGTKKGSIADDVCLEAVRILKEEYVGKGKLSERETAERCRQAAGALEELIRDYPDCGPFADKAADELLVRFTKLTRQEVPANMLVLIEYRGRQQHIDTALEAWDSACGICTPEDLAAAGGNVLRSGKAELRHFVKVQSWLEGEIARKPKSLPSLYEAQAVLFEYQGNFDKAAYDKAAEAYRKALQLAPNRQIALNNLAYLLAMQPGGKGPAEALELLTELEKMVGPVAELRDTRAMAYLNQQQPEAAIEELKKGLKQQPRNATLQFHLAQACQAIGQRDAARSAWNDALASGLNPASLHPLDLLAWTKLQSQLTASR
jgi:tetratricopeptide (TPR) repeat protein